MTIRLPDRKHTAMTAVADPLKFYYLPVARSFYSARFDDATTLLGGRVESLLDFGTGSGVFLPELSRWCDKLHACDIHTNIKYVTDMVSKEGINANVVQSWPEKIPLEDASVDAVVSMSVLEHISNLAPYVEEIDRVLKPGGRAIIGVPVDNPMTRAIFRISYLLLPQAKLEDEHVSTHADVIAEFRRRFDVGRILHIPRWAPEIVRMYTTTLFLKRARVSSAILDGLLLDNCCSKRRY